MSTSSRFLPLLLCVAACSGAAPSEPVTPEPVAPAVESKGNVKSESADKPKAPATPPGPLPPGTATPDFPTVALVGFGLRFELNPPFQAARMAGLLEEGNPHVLFVSWWNVHADGAGQHGRAGLYNVGIVPHALPDGATTFAPVEIERHGKKTIALRLGTDGTELRLPAGINALGGMGLAKVGPNTDTWKIQVDTAEPVEWPENTMLHSWDPKDGGPLYFDKMPRQPFGPWLPPPPGP
jgi:hypothetical protein